MLGVSLRRIPIGGRQGGDMDAPLRSAGGAGGRDPRRSHRRVVLVRGLLVLGVLTAALLGVIGWRASGVLNALLRNWAVEALSQLSGGVYRLDVGPVHVNWPLRRVTVDSVRLTTNVGVNAKGAPPLPDLKLAFDRCALSGIHLVTLVLGRGFVAGSFGCRK